MGRFGLGSRCSLKPKTMLFLSVCTAMVAVPAFGGTPEETFWSGQASCEVSVQSAGYAHHETQTWTITAGAPTMQGQMQVYPGVWSVSGQGSTQRPVGAQALQAGWDVTVPGISAPFAVFYRGFDHRLVIKAWHSQLRQQGSIRGTRQVGAVGAAPAPSALVSDAFEWQFPTVEGDPTSMHVSGSGTVEVGGSYLPLQPTMTSTRAACTWNFVKGSPSTVNAPTPLLATVASAPASLLGIKRMPVAPGGFTVQPQGPGAVQLTWQAAPGATGYIVQGPGVAAPGLTLARTATAVTIQGVPGGPGTWRIQAVFGTDPLDPKAAATVSAILRYQPPHAPAWLSKANGPGNDGLAIVHYLSLFSRPEFQCPLCLPGATFTKVALALGVPQELVLGQVCYDGFANPAASGGYGTICGPEEALYTNVTDFGTSRGTHCFATAPMNNTLCYSKSGDHGLTVIFATPSDYWFMTFASSDPKANVWAYTLTTDVTLDSEGPKSAPHACLSCHGGKFQPNGHVTGATLLPLDPGLLQVTDRSDGNALQILAVNQAVMAAVPAAPSGFVSDYLAGLYGGDPRNIKPNAVQHTHTDPVKGVDVVDYVSIDPGGDSSAKVWGNPDFVPKGWADQAGLYRAVVKPHCAMCHLAQPSALSFAAWPSFDGNKELIYTTACQSGAMPHSEVAFKSFWTKDTGVVYLPGLLATSVGHASCP
jgi:hypothetical protein